MLVKSYIAQTLLSFLLLTNSLLAQDQPPVDAEKEKEAEAAQEVIKNGAVYGTSHPGAFHYAITLVPNGYYNIELEDGSRWQVAYNEIFNMLNWLPSDVLVIVPNYDLFSSYYYRIVNQATGVSVAVNLVDVSSWCAGCGHWLVGYENRSGIIFLEDGSAWQPTYNDLILSDRWWTNDRLIIGINTGPDWIEYPNILINARKIDYVRAECID